MQGHYQYRQKRILKICNFLLWLWYGGLSCAFNVVETEVFFHLFKQFLETEWLGANQSF